MKENDFFNAFINIRLKLIKVRIVRNALTKVLIFCFQQQQSYIKEKKLEIEKLKMKSETLFDKKRKRSFISPVTR